MFFVFLRELHTHDCVWLLEFFWPYFSYIVEKTCTFGLLYIHSKFAGHDRTEVRYLTRVLEQILSVRGPESHSSHHLHKFWVKAVDA